MAASSTHILYITTLVSTQHSLCAQRERHAISFNTEVVAYFAEGSITRRREFTFWRLSEAQRRFLAVCWTAFDAPGRVCAYGQEARVQIRRQRSAPAWQATDSAARPGHRSDAGRDDVTGHDGACFPQHRQVGGLLTGADDNGDASRRSHHSRQAEEAHER